MQRTFCVSELYATACRSLLLEAFRMLQKLGTCPGALAPVPGAAVAVDAAAAGTMIGCTDAATCGDMSGADAANDALMSTTDTSVRLSVGWCCCW